MIQISVYDIKNIKNIFHLLFEIANVCFDLSPVKANDPIQLINNIEINIIINVCIIIILFLIPFFAFLKVLQHLRLRHLEDCDHE